MPRCCCNAMGHSARCLSPAGVTLQPAEGQWRRCSSRPSLKALAGIPASVATTSRRHARSCPASIQRLDAGRVNPAVSGHDGEDYQQLEQRKPARVWPWRIIMPPAPAISGLCGRQHTNVRRVTGTAPLAISSHGVERKRLSIRTRHAVLIRMAPAGPRAVRRPGRVHANGPPASHRPAV